MTLLLPLSVLYIFLKIIIIKMMVMAKMILGILNNRYLKRCVDKLL